MGRLRPFLRSPMKTLSRNFRRVDPSARFRRGAARPHIRFRSKQQQGWTLYYTAAAAASRADPHLGLSSSSELPAVVVRLKQQQQEARKTFSKKPAKNA